MAWDPAPTRDDAIAQLQIKAARIGANGLAGVSCDPPMAATLIPDCWQSLVCRAQAVRVP
jgi:uncharacterized protein YbjQ (UPF0145 family)